MKGKKERLNPNSIVICGIDIWGVKDEKKHIMEDGSHQCHELVQNTREEIEKHCEKHGFNHIKEGAPWTWQRDWFFLRPDGSKFSIPAEYRASMYADDCSEE